MSIYEKLVEIQQKLRAPKTQYNSFSNFYYRSLEDIETALKPLLKEHGLVLLFNDEIVEISGRWYVKAIATVSDGENHISTCSYAREQETKKGMDASQITGACSSYARKYAANALFAIDDTKDSDGQKNAEPISEKQKKAIYAAAKGHSKEEMKSLIKKRYGVESSSELTQTQASDLLDYLNKEATNENNK